MKYETKFQVLQLADLVTPPYNPRVDMEPGTRAYEALRRSIEQHEVVEPPVVNLHNMRCIGGNQRVAVMLALGMTETVCSVIDQPDETKEKMLCLALNRIEGRWDNDKLGDLLRDDAVLDFETGFDSEEVKVYRLLEDGKDPDAGDDPYDYDPDAGTDDEDGQDDQDAEDDGAGEDAEPSVGNTVVKIGPLSFKVDVPRYRRTIEAMRDEGIFNEREISEELKRRLLADD